MTTYVFVEKNGSCSLTLSANDEDDARKTLGEVVRFPDEWRLEDTLTED